MKSKKTNHKEAEEIDQEIIRATEYGEQQCERKIDIKTFEISTSTH